MLKVYMARESLGNPSLVKLTFFVQRCCEPVHITICSEKTLIFQRCKFLLLGLWPCKHLQKIQMVMKTHNAIDNWSNNIVFGCSRTQYVFHKTKLVWLQNANHAVVFGLVSTIRATKLKLKLTATTFTMIGSPQINCNMKATSLRLYEKERVMWQKNVISLPKASRKNFPVLIWTKWNRVRRCRFQTAVFCLNVLQRQKWPQFAKKQTTLQDRIASNINYFHRIQTSRKFANASYEPHYAVAERHLIFLHICKMVLQNNRWFCAFVYLVRDINWNNVETTANIVSSVKCLVKDDYQA